MFAAQPETESQPSTRTPWWGQFRIAHGTTGRWRIGPMTMWIERLRGEWKVATVTDLDDRHGRIELRVPEDEADRQDIPESANELRFGVSGEDEHITITPQLADRLVVTTPVKPFYIPADEEVTIFVGSPLWVRIDTAKSKLCEFPIFRPSDTWFGINTMVGELGYASRTACRMRFEDFEVEPHRAVTAVTVHNRARTPLLLERMKLPVEYLHLFVSESGVFWTRDLDITHKEHDGMAGVEPGPPRPQLAVNPQPVSEPRSHIDENLVMRVFTSIFR